MYFNKDKQATKSNSPGLWTTGCHDCGKPFKDDEAFCRVDLEDGIFNDEVFGFHKGKCWELGMNKLSQANQTT